MGCGSPHPRTHLGAMAPDPSHGGEPPAPLVVGYKPHMAPAPGRRCNDQTCYRYGKARALAVSCNRPSCTQRLAQGHNDKTSPAYSARALWGIRLRGHATSPSPGVLTRQERARRRWRRRRPPSQAWVWWPFASLPSHAPLGHPPRDHGGTRMGPTLSPVMGVVQGNPRLGA